jgi:hypothetical protein
LSADGRGPALRRAFAAEEDSSHFLDRALIGAWSIVSALHAAPLLGMDLAKLRCGDPPHFAATLRA